MTRRRIIAGVILLAAVVVAVPFGPGVWRQVAYREEIAAGMAYRIKRWEWLPGRAAYVPDQACRSCRCEQHEGCLMRHPPTDPNKRWFAVPSSGDDVYVFTASMPRGGWNRLKATAGDMRVFEFPSDFTCTCADPSFWKQPTYRYP